MPSGTVKVFFEDKGFGFITPDGGGDDVFVHRKVAGADRTAYLEEGDAVDYEVEYNDRRGGQYAASSCTGFKTGGSGGRFGRKRGVPVSFVGATLSDQRLQGGGLDIHDLDWGFQPGNRPSRLGDEGMALFDAVAPTAALDYPPLIVEMYQKWNPDGRCGRLSRVHWASTTEASRPPVPQPEPVSRTPSRACTLTHARTSTCVRPKK